MTQTISLALDEFLLASRAEEKSLKTQCSYKDILEDFVKFTGNIPVDTLTPSHLRGYLENVASRPGRQGGFSSHSVHKYWSVVRTFVRWMYLKEYISRPITEQVLLSQPALNPPDILNEEDVRRLFDYLAIKGEFRDVVIFKTLLDTGLRVHELTNLNLGDLNLNTRTILIKGGNGQPTLIPVGNELQHDLSIYIREHRKCEPS